MKCFAALTLAALLAFPVSAADWPILSDGGNQYTAGAATASSLGTSVAAGSPANSLGSWVQLVAAGSNPGGVLILFVENTTSSQRSVMLNIGIGPSGSQVIVVPQLYCAMGPYALAQAVLPIYIPPGVALWVQSQGVVAASAVYVTASLVMPGFMPSTPFQRVTAYGASSLTSQGITVDPGGTVNTKGAWTEISASIANPTKMLLMGVGQLATSGAAVLCQLVDIGVGPSSGAVTTIISNIPVYNNGSYIVLPCFVGPFPATIPAGSNLWGRSQCNNNGATVRLLSIALYGID